MDSKPDQLGLFDRPRSPAEPASGLSRGTPVTVSVLSTHIVALFERDELLRDVWVTGEVSNWKKAASGHLYFSLKDSGATIQAVMWRRSASALSWLPANGDQIVAHGYVGVYAERGGYQLYVNRLQPAGRGQLYAQFERLKEQLAAAGLLDAARKRPIPPNIRRVGIVTSPDAAALRDSLRMLANRWPLIDVVVFPTLVQGSEAAGQVVKALVAANRYSTDVEEIQAILLVRGGGSIEDLWSFNDQRVAYAIAESEIPVITGVGHETDFTIADFVADLRTPTPSAAAVAVTPDQSEIKGGLGSVRHGLATQIQTQINLERDATRQRLLRLERVHPQRALDLRRQQLDERTRQLHTLMNGQLARSQEQLRAAKHRLAALNPRNVLQRGYSIVQQADGRIATDPVDIELDATLTVQAAGGQYTVRRIDN